jgi:hypothetical protein
MAGGTGIRSGNPSGKLFPADSSTSYRTFQPWSRFSSGKNPLDLFIDAGTPETPWGTKMAVIGQRVIPWEKLRLPYAHYITVNEGLGFRIQEAIQGRGTKGGLLVVGGLRAMGDSAAMGNHPHYRAIFLDMDPLINQLHLHVLSRIPTAQNRHELIALLLGRSPNPELIDQARQGPPEGQAERDAQFILETLKLPMDQPLAKNKKDELGPELIQAIRSLVGEHHADGALWKRSVLGSEHAFETYKAQVMAGQIAVVGGNLADGPALPGIAAALKSSGDKLEVIDISNVPDSVPPARLAERLSELPLTSDATIVITEQFYGQFTFGSFFIPAKDFFAAHEQGLLSKASGISDVERILGAMARHNTSTLPGVIIPDSAFLQDPILLNPPSERTVASFTKKVGGILGEAGHPSPRLSDELTFNLFWVLRGFTQEKEVTAEYVGQKVKYLIERDGGTISDATALELSKQIVLLWEAEILPAGF